MSLLLPITVWALLLVASRWEPDSHTTAIEQAGQWHVIDSIWHIVRWRQFNLKGWDTWDKMLRLRASPEFPSQIDCVDFCLTSLLLTGGVLDTENGDLCHLLRFETLQWHSFQWDEIAICHHTSFMAVQAWKFGTSVAALQSNGQVSRSRAPCKWNLGLSGTFPINQTEMFHANGFSLRKSLLKGAPVQSSLFMMTMVWKEVRGGSYIEPCYATFPDSLCMARLTLVLHS